MRTLIMMLAMLVACTVRAGTPCTDVAPTPETVRKALTLAQRTHEALARSGASLVLIARVGQDLSKYGLRYSHFGFGIRDGESGGWKIVHQLNQCGTAQSGIFEEGIGNFFLDDMHAYETLMLVPSEATQARLSRLLADGTAAKLHNGRYNMLAYAFDTRYQNSNQWALEIYALAAGGEPAMTSREQAQSWLRVQGFVPTTVQLDAMTRLGARMFRANVAFDDHPFDRRMSGMIDTVTVDSVFRFVGRRETESRHIHLTLN